MKKFGSQMSVTMITVRHKIYEVVIPERYDRFRITEIYNSRHVPGLYLVRLGSSKHFPER